MVEILWRFDLQDADSGIFVVVMWSSNNNDGGVWDCMPLFGWYFDHIMLLSDLLLSGGSFDGRIVAWVFLKGVSDFFFFFFNFVPRSWFITIVVFTSIWGYKRMSCFLVLGCVFCQLALFLSGGLYGIVLLVFWFMSVRFFHKL